MKKIFLNYNNEIIQEIYHKSCIYNNAFLCKTIQLFYPKLIIETNCYYTADEMLSDIFKFHLIMYNNDLEHPNFNYGLKDGEYYNFDLKKIFNI